MAPAAARNTICKLTTGCRYLSYSRRILLGLCDQRRVDARLVLNIGSFCVEYFSLCSKKVHVHSVQPRPVREEHTFTQALRLGHEVAERPSPFLCHCATPCFIAFPIELIALLGHHFRCLFQLVFPPVHGYHSNRFRRDKRLTRKN